MSASQIQLSAREIVTLADTYRQKRNDLRISAENCKRNIADISDRASQAQKLLSLAKDIEGFERERELAESVIKECAVDLAKAEERLKIWQREVKEWEKKLDGLDPAALESAIRRTEDGAKIQALAQRLKPGVVVSPNTI